MDLVEVYLARNQISKPSLLLIKPLLKSTKIRKEQNPISKKATKLLKDSLCHAKVCFLEFSRNLCQKTPISGPSLNIEMLVKSRNSVKNLNFDF